MPRWRCRLHSTTTSKEFPWATDPMLPPPSAWLGAHSAAARQSASSAHLSGEEVCAQQKVDAIASTRPSLNPLALKNSTETTLLFINTFWIKGDNAFMTEWLRCWFQAPMRKRMGSSPIECTVLKHVFLLLRLIGSVATAKNVF